jgi:hypothetical protein
MGKKNEWEEAMKTYEKLIEELMETSPVNSMGGGFSVGQASSNSGNLDGYDPVMPWGMHRRKKRKKKLVGEMFAGCPVFEVSSDDFTKCSHGRNRYERWGKKMNMEEGENQNIRTYVHRNPGKPIIIKDSTYGTMSYLIPRQNVNESVEVEEGSFSTLFKTTGKDNEGKERHGWSDFAKGRLNKTMERVQKRKEEKKSKYNAMTPAEQKAHDRMWAEVKADKIEKMSRG